MIAAGSMGDSAMRKLVMAALAVSIFAAPAYAAQSRKKVEPPPPPPQFRVDVATRTMALTRLALGFPETSIIGDVSVGMFCSGKTPVYASNAFAAVPKDDYAKVFAAEAAAAGYRQAGSQTDLFATGDGSTPEIQIGAAIVSLSEHGCSVGNIFSPAVAIDAVMRIEWQVYDPLEKKLLYRATNEGATKARREVAHTSDNIEQAKRDEMRGLAALAPDAARDAFQQAAKAILADPNFVAAVRDPNGGPTTAPGTLFPEAATSAPPSPTRIAHIPMSAAPFKDQVTKLREQVVTVETGRGSGSGFYIADGLLLTNQHVIAGTQRVKIRFLGGRQIDGQVVASNAKRDVALIKTDGAGVAGLPLRLENPELTAQVFVVGSPLGEKQEGSVLAGIVSAFRSNPEGPYIQSDVAVTHGNSGGPMFDDKGNVVALVVSGVEKTAINFFIPIADALKALEIGFAGDVQAAGARP
jgi:serine protease Do